MYKQYELFPIERTAAQIKPKSKPKKQRRRKRKIFTQTQNWRRYRLHQHIKPCEAHKVGGNRVKRYITIPKDAALTKKQWAYIKELKEEFGYTLQSVIPSEKINSKQQNKNDKN